MNTENSKTNESHKFVLNLSQKLRFKKKLLLKTYPLFTCGKIRKQYKNNNLKIIAPTWNNEFELPDGSYSVSDIQIILNLSLKSMSH